MKAILVALIAVVSLYAEQPLRNGCAPETRAWQLLHDAGCWSRLVRIEYGNEKDGHAVCVFALANNDIWLYDCNSGSHPLATKSRDIVEVTRALGDYYEKIRSSRFIDE